MKNSTSKSVVIWETFKQALRGGHQDYTTGSIRKAIFLLAIPMILELSLESVFAIVDIFFVSKLGENAITTVGLTEAVITIIYSIGMGLSTAATAVVARRVGEKNHEDAAHAGAQSLIIAFVASVVLSVIGIIYAPELLNIMGATDAVIKEGTNFTRISLGSSLSIMLLFLINGIFRGAGDASIAMKSLWIASILNIILCPILIHFFGLGGAAIATATGRSVGVVYQCYHLFKGSGLLKFYSRQFVFNKSIISNLIEVALPATMQFMISSGSWIILTKFVAEIGSTPASAGYQIAIRNVVFFILPAWGLSNAAATLVGQNLGANELKRAEQSVLLTTKYNAIFMAFVMLLFLFLSVPIMHIFSKEKHIIDYGAQALQVIGSGYIFYGIGMVMMQALNGAGYTKIPTIINLVSYWLFQIPLAYVLSLEWGLVGVYMAIPIAETFAAILAWYHFRRGKWKEVKV